MAEDTYRVAYTQINRAETGKDPLRRGTEFAASDVTEDELQRWLGLQPPAVVAVKDASDASDTEDAAAARIAELEQELAEARAEHADAVSAQAVTVGSVGTANLTGTGTSVEPGGDDSGDKPSGNASKDEWVEWVDANHVEDSEWAHDEATTRNEIRDKYKS